MLRSEETALVPAGLKLSHKAVFQLVRRDWSLNSHTCPVTYSLLSIFKFIAHFLLRLKRLDQWIVSVLVSFLFERRLYLTIPKRKEVEW